MYVSGQRHVPAALSPRKNYRTDFIGGCLGLRTGLEFWRRGNMSPLVGSELRTFKLVASRHTDWNMIRYIC